MAKVGSLESELRNNFAAARAERDAANGLPLNAADRMAVRGFQQARLAATHADLLASSQYGPAAHFFLTELYSTEDMTQRDADIERVIKILVRFLPDNERADGASRYYALGRTVADRYLFLSFRTDGKATRVVAAREMSETEQKFYDRKYAEFR